MVWLDLTDGADVAEDLVLLVPNMNRLDLGVAVEFEPASEWWDAVDGEAGAKGGREPVGVRREWYEVGEEALSNRLEVEADGSRGLRYEVGVAVSVAGESLCV
jgi:hypothetical protein